MPQDKRINTDTGCTCILVLFIIFTMSIGIYRSSFGWNDGKVVKIEKLSTQLSDGTFIYKKIYTIKTSDGKLIESRPLSVVSIKIGAKVRFHLWGSSIDEISYDIVETRTLEEEIKEEVENGN